MIDTILRKTKNKMQQFIIILNSNTKRKQATKYVTFRKLNLWLIAPKGATQVN